MLFHNSVNISAIKKAYPAVSPSIRLAKYRINTIGLPVAVSMMMMDMNKFCHCGAKVSRFLKAPKKL
jgi:hypothetical protein